MHLEQMTELSFLGEVPLKQIVGTRKQKIQRARYAHSAPNNRNVTQTKQLHASS